MLLRAHRFLVDHSGHRLCCRIPSWTTRVGQRWDTSDVAPYNLYNVLWVLWQKSEQSPPVN